VFASIVPLTRLPKHVHHFTYAVPEELQEVLAPGMLVAMPFRNRPALGLVFSLDVPEPDRPVKPIGAVLNHTPLLTTAHLLFAQTCANLYGVSLAVIIKMMLPPLQKRKLQKAELKSGLESNFQGHSDAISSGSRQSRDVAEIAPNVFGSTVARYGSRKEHISYITDHFHSPGLLLVPRVTDIAELTAQLPKELCECIIIWHSELSQKEQFDAWMRVRNEPNALVIGTRGAVFLPFFGLSSIIIDIEHDEQHKHWDMAPRFHAKDIASLLAAQYGSARHDISYSPSPESYYLVHKKKAAGDAERIAPRPAPESMRIIDMQDERRSGNFNVLSEPLAEALLSARGDVFLYVNRKGYASAAGCRDCGHVMRCETCGLPHTYSEQKRKLLCHHCRSSAPFTGICPVCRGVLTPFSGPGTEQIETVVTGLLPSQHGARIIRMDSDAELPPLKEEGRRRVIIGTEMAFGLVRWEQTDVIGFVTLDAELAIPEYRAAENAWHRLQETIFCMKKDAWCFVQTNNKNQLVVRGLRQPDRFYRTELSMRKALGYPPYTYLVRFFGGAATEQESKKTARAVYETLSLQLTEHQKRATLRPPITMHPSYFRRQYWHAILATVPSDSWQETVPLLARHVPHTWKIDPNPISLLHP